jgi:hypothetical protein
MLLKNRKYLAIIVILFIFIATTLAGTILYYKYQVEQRQRNADEAYMRSLIESVNNQSNTWKVSLLLIDVHFMII